MARNPKQDANLRPIKKGELSKEEAKKRGSKGGKKSGEVRRIRRDAKKTIQYILELDAAEGIKDNLIKAGIPPEAQSNMTALWTKCYTDWLKTGDIKLLETLMRYGGFDETEIRKNRESEARMRAMENGTIGRQSTSVTDGDGGDSVEDVFVYLPDNGRDRALQRQLTGGGDEEDCEDASAETYMGKINRER